MHRYFKFDLIAVVEKIVFHNRKADEKFLSIVDQNHRNYKYRQQLKVYLCILQIIDLPLHH